MADLEEEHKLYILEQLAQFRPATKIQAELKEQFRVSVTLPQISFYKPKLDPAQWQISDQHKAYFLMIREVFLTDRSGIALTHFNYRLQRLQDILDDPVTGKSAQRVMQVIELYEKIAGGHFAKKKEDDTGTAEGLRLLRDFLGVKTDQPAPVGENASLPASEGEASPDGE